MNSAKELAREVFHAWRINTYKSYCFDKTDVTTAEALIAKALESTAIHQSVYADLNAGWMQELTTLHKNVESERSKVKLLQDELEMKSKRSHYQWSSGAEYNGVDWENEGSIKLALQLVSRMKEMK